MKRGVLLICVSLISLISVGQILPTKQMQYAFLKWYITNSSPKKVSKKFAPFEGPNFSLNEFDDLKDNYEVKQSDFKVLGTDLAFIRAQVLKNKKSKKIEIDSLKNADWHNTIDPDLPITHISLPVFSCDGNTVFISSYFHCGGLCGNGAIEIYRKINGEWKRFPVKYWGIWNN